VSVGILALDSSQGWRDLFALAVRDTVAFTFNPFVVGGFQDSAAFAVPGAWWVLGSVYWGALLGGPSSFVLGPHPAGEFGCLLPTDGLELLAVLGLLPGSLGAGDWLGALFDGSAELVITLLAVPGLGRGAAGRTIGVLVWRHVGVIGTVDSHRASQQLRSHIEIE